jgi:sortase (surface protein transpeptidase)
MSQRSQKGRHRRRATLPLWMVASAAALAIFASPAAQSAFPTARSGAGAVPYGSGAGHDQRSHKHSGTVAPPGPAVDASSSGHAAPGSSASFRVVIPSIGVDASVIDLGLNADGTLQVPSDYTVAGWYAGGPEPGDVGPAVIVGHVDSRNGPAVFYGLRSLGSGDVVAVYKGSRKLKFVVQSIGQYAKAAFPTQKVYGLVHYAALRLITCGGVFDPATGHYTDNIVVFAKLA